MPAVRRTIVIVALLALPILAAPAAAAAKLPRVVTGKYEDFHGLELRPADIVTGYERSSVLGGPEGRTVYDPGTLNWTTYTRKEAAAVGKIWFSKCTGECKRRRTTGSADVAVRLSRPRDGYFTRMRVRYTEPSTGEHARRARRWPGTRRAGTST